MCRIDHNLIENLMFSLEILPRQNISYLQLFFLAFLLDDHHLHCVEDVDLDIGVHYSSFDRVYHQRIGISIEIPSTLHQTHSQRVGIAEILFESPLNSYSESWNLLQDSLSRPSIHGDRISIEIPIPQWR
jgi:hypothetical protein